EPRELELAQEGVLAEPIRFALRDAHDDRRLPIGRREERARAIARHRGVRRDEHVAKAAHRFDAEAQRGHVDEERRRHPPPGVRGAGGAVGGAGCAANCSTGESGRVLVNGVAAGSDDGAGGGGGGATYAGGAGGAGGGAEGNESFGETRGSEISGGRNDVAA